MIQKIQKAIVNGLYYTANLLCLVADLISPTSDELWRGRGKPVVPHDVPGKTGDIIDIGVGFPMPESAGIFRGGPGGEEGLKIVTPQDISLAPKLPFQPLGPEPRWAGDAARGFSSDIGVGDVHDAGWDDDDDNCR